VIRVVFSTICASLSKFCNGLLQCCIGIIALLSSTRNTSLHQYCVVVTLLFSYFMFKMLFTLAMTWRINFYFLFVIYIWKPYHYWLRTQNIHAYQLNKWYFIQRSMHLLLSSCCYCWSIKIQISFLSHIYASIVSFQNIFLVFPTVYFKLYHNLSHQYCINIIFFKHSTHNLGYINSAVVQFWFF